MFPALKLCESLRSSLVNPTPIAVLVTKENLVFCTTCKNEIKTRCKKDKGLITTLDRHCRDVHARESTTTNSCVIHEADNGTLQITYDLRKLFHFEQKKEKVEEEEEKVDEEEEKVDEEEEKVDEEEEKVDEEEEKVDEEEEKVDEEEEKVDEEEEKVDEEEEKVDEEEEKVDEEEEKVDEEEEKVDEEEEKVDEEEEKVDEEEEKVDEEEEKVDEEEEKVDEEEEKVDEEEEKVDEEEEKVDEEEEKVDEEEEKVDEEEEKVDDEDGKSENSEHEENTKIFSNSWSGDYDHNVDACFHQTCVTDSRRCSLESPILAGIHRRGDIKDEENVPPVSNVSQNVSYISFDTERIIFETEESMDPHNARIASPQRDHRSGIYNGELNPGAHLTIEAEIGTILTFKINGALSELPSTGGVAPITTTFNEGPNQCHVFTASAMAVGKWATLFKMMNGPQAIITVKFY